MTGTTNRAPLPGLDEAEQVRHKGELRLPEPDAVVLGRPRRGVRAAAARGRPHADRVLAAVRAATRSRPPTSTRPTPATSGTWSTSRTGRSASRCSAACRRGPTRTAGSRRWRTTAPTSGAGCCPGWRPGWPMADRYDAVVVGLGALGSAAAYAPGPARPPRARARAVRARARARRLHDTSRILRHSYHTPGLRPADPGGVRRLGATSSAGRASSWSPSSAGSTCSRPTRRSRWTTTRRRSTRSASSYELLDVAEIGRRWPQFSLPAGTVGLYQDRGAIVPAGRGTALMQKLAAAAGAELRGSTRVLSVVDGPSGVDGVDGRPRRSSPTGSSCAPTPGPTRCSPASDVHVPLETTLEQVTYFAPERPGSFAPHQLPLWIWMDDPSFYGFPCYGEPTVKAAQDCGGPVVDPRPSRGPPSPTRRCWSGSPTFMASVLPGVRAAGALDPLPVHPDARPRLRPRARSPATSRSSSASAPAHGFKFAPTFGRLLAELATVGRDDDRPHAVPARPSRPDRPGVRRRTGWSEDVGRTPPAGCVNLIAGRATLGHDEVRPGGDALHG